MGFLAGLGTERGEVEGKAAKGKFGMTWVVGAPIFNSAILMSDIQATISYPGQPKKPPVYIDCVRKVYPVCRDMAAGFSGSIRLGFHFLADAQRYFSVVNPGWVWQPWHVANKWSRRLRWGFSKLHENQKMPVHFLLVGASPFPGPLALTYAWILKSPGFEPEPIPHSDVSSIGSGNGVDDFIRIIKQLNDEYPVGLLQAESGNIGGFGGALLMHLMLEATEVQAKGISVHFHCCLVTRGNIRFGNSDREKLSSDGQVTEEIRMPPTANSWKEFQRIMHEKGISLAQAGAVG